jgi:hypothetical protein
VQDRPDITYNGRIGHGDRGCQERICQEKTRTFWYPKDYFVCSSEDATLYEEQGQNRLYNLSFTRWKRANQTENADKKGLIILWQLDSKKSPLLGDKFCSTNTLNNNDIYENMKKQSYRLSLEELIGELQKTSIVCASPDLLNTPEGKAIQNNEYLNENIDFNKTLSFEENNIKVNSTIELQ